MSLFGYTKCIRYQQAWDIKNNGICIYKGFRSKYIKMQGLSMMSGLCSGCSLLSIYSSLLQAQERDCQSQLTLCSWGNFQHFFSRVGSISKPFGEISFFAWPLQVQKTQKFLVYSVRISTHYLQVFSPIYWSKFLDCYQIVCCFMTKTILCYSGFYLWNNQSTRRRGILNETLLFGFTRNKLLAAVI